jgi:D-alanine-D-alanine ligase
MSSKKTKVAILFGGRSPEHNISLLSAKNVIDAIDREKFEPILIGIDKTGKWHLNEGSLQLLNPDDANKVSLVNPNNPILLSQNTNEHSLISQTSQKEISQIDVIFPVLHGTYGEDGTVQGFAKLANIPCVGCGILGSAVGMDKDVCKRLLRDSGIGIADFVTLRKGYNEHISYNKIENKLGNELFIKPANLGSSVGVSYTQNEEEFKKALKYAFEFDPKVIVEEKVVGREIECAVLGNSNPKASAVGEVVPKSSFYSFDNKYIDEDGAALEIPANLDLKTVEKIQDLAVKTFRLLECSGMARVDMFLKSDGDIIINEINTIPGFTKISMYPKLWDISGISYTDLITELIQLAINRQNNQNQLRMI